MGGSGRHRVRTRAGEAAAHGRQGFVAAVVLAAGEGRRFGGFKPLAALDGRPLVRWVVDAAASAGLAPVLVVGPAGEEGLPAALAGSGARVLANPDAASGMASSIALGLGALTARGDVQAAVLLHADQPLLPAGLLAALQAAYRQSDVDAVAPSYRGTVAPPVLVGRALWHEFRALRGDRGGKGVLLRRPERVAVLDIDEPIPLDIDGPDDLALARRQLASER